MYCRYIVSENKINKLEKEFIKKDVVGIKAYGLLRMPAAWTPDFFVVSKKFYKTYVECQSYDERDIVVNKYINNINKCISKLGWQDCNVIIRSSGITEGMQERGQYESIKCKIEDIKKEFITLIHTISTSSTVSNNEMPFIIQKYIQPIIIGHLSNEYRFSKECRDWKYQYEFRGESSDIEKISIRNWREKIDISVFEKKPIINNNLKSALKILASFYTNASLRTHIEFVCDNKILYAVQADEDIEEKDVINPTDYNINMCEIDTRYKFKILREVTDEDGKKYDKIRNVFIYKLVGLKTVPMYILDNYNEIKNLTSGHMSNDLRNDFDILLGRPIVIRSDIESSKKKEKQMLSRSTELNSITTVEQWLYNHSSEILNQNGVFIIHHFVPAISSAFAHAKPKSRKVEIQSLWGLPEGLYYNTHDRIIVDTKKLDLNQCSISSIKPQDIKKKINFKSMCVFPNSRGEWKTEKIARPYDWKCSITDEESIKQIAIDSRKIAENENKEVSIMWFVGIDCQYYKAKNIPWHHEEITIESYTDDNYKRKYFSEEEVTIRNNNDLQKLIDNPSHIKCIRIQPNDEETLRDKEFIRKVGNFAVKNDVRILLEGAVLAHPFYQLKSTKASVIVSPSFEEYSEDIEFNKLVRDKIPINIINSGEVVRCAVAKEGLHFYLLVNKLLEETYEAYDADVDEILEELADVDEVCDSILNGNFNHIQGMSRNINVDFNREQYYHKCKFSHYIGVKEYYQFCQDNYRYIVGISRKKQFYEIELQVQDKHINIEDIPKRKYRKSTLLSKLIDEATDILNTVEMSKIKEKVYEIKKTINNILIELDVTRKEFDTLKNCKSKDKGGFQKGYILLKTEFSGSSDFFDDFNEIEHNFPRLSTLPVRKPKTSIELLKKEDNLKLLIRQLIPMGKNQYREIWSGNRITAFFDSEDNIDFFFEHTNKIISISLGIRKNNQISLDIL